MVCMGRVFVSQPFEADADALLYRYVCAMYVCMRVCLCVCVCFFVCVCVCLCMVCMGRVFVHEYISMLNLTLIWRGLFFEF